MLNWAVEAGHKVVAYVIDMLKYEKGARDIALQYIGMVEGDEGASDD